MIATIIAVVVAFVAGYASGSAFSMRRLAKQVSSTLVSDSSRPSVSCPPEVIAPNRTTKGYCGITGCKIGRPHSHVMDLIQRIKQKQK